MVYWIKHRVCKDSTYVTTKSVDTQLGSRILTQHRSRSLASSLKPIGNKAKNSTRLLVPGKTKKSRRRCRRGSANTSKKTKLKSEGSDRLGKVMKYDTSAASPLFNTYINTKTEAENCTSFSSIIE